MDNRLFEYLFAALTPVEVLFDLNSIGLTNAAKHQLKGLGLGELIMISNDFTDHRRLNQIGKIKLKMLKNLIVKSEAYKRVVKGF